jgi:hypothetical protein
MAQKKSKMSGFDGGRIHLCSFHNVLPLLESPISSINILLNYAPVSLRQRLFCSLRAIHLAESLSFHSMHRFVDEKVRMITQGEKKR